MEYDQNGYALERHASCRGRTTPEITWRVWIKDMNQYVEFRTKKDAKAYMTLGKEVPNA